MYQLYRKETSDLRGKCYRKQKELGVQPAQDCAMG